MKFTLRPWLALLAILLFSVFLFAWFKAAVQDEKSVHFVPRSKAQLLLTMRNDPYFRAIERRFPHIAIKAVERGWRVRELGGNDTETRNVMRKTIAEIYPILVGEADDAALENFAILVVEQAKAARSLSYEACGQLLESELNISVALPAQYFERERAWMMQALQSPGNDTARRSPQTIAAALSLLRSRLKPAQIDAVVNPAQNKNQAMRCDGAIALYEAALSLPPDEKAAALEGLFKR